MYFFKKIVIWGIILGFIFNNGCSRKKNLFKKEKKKASILNQLKKIEILEKLGFYKECESHYRKFCNETFPKNIRYKAYMGLDRTLEKQGELRRLFKLREEILNIFPIKASFLRDKILKYYKSLWKWEKVIKFSQGKEKKRWERLVNKWENMKKVYEENFKKYKINKRGTFIIKKGKLVTLKIRSNTSFILKKLEINNMSFEISFDVKFIKIDWGTSRVFGIKKDEEYYILAVFCCVDSQTTPRYIFYIKGKAKEQGCLVVCNKCTFKLKEVYHFNILYYKELKEAKLEIWRNGELEGFQILKFNYPFIKGKYKIGFFPTKQTIENGMNKILFDNIVVRIEDY